MIRAERVKINDVQPYPGNARIGNLDAIRESLRVNGQYRTIVVQESTGFILAGNHTWEAAREEGWLEIEVGFVDVGDEHAKRIVAVDNRTNDLATYDDQALANLLVDLEDLEGTGFDQFEVDALLATLGPGGFKKSEIEKVIAPPDEPKTRAGDAIELGPHRLYCFDAFDAPMDVTMTMDMVWTDPPYMVTYLGDDTTEEHMAASYHRTDGKTVANEHLKGSDAALFMGQSLALIHDALKPGGAYYLHMPPGPDMSAWINAAQSSGLLTKQVLIWVKDKFVFGRSDYHYRHEPILYGWKEGAAHTWENDRTQDTVWEVPRPKASKQHPTMKPVEIAARAIVNSTKPGGVVFDPFAGSGTVLVAAMQEGRRVVMFELDPAYCDVIVERWERLTGNTAKHIRAEITHV